MINGDIYVSFFAEIASRQLIDKEYFTNSLLDSIEKYFGYKNTLIQFYDTNGEFLSWRTRDGIQVNSNEHPFNRLSIDNDIRNIIFNDSLRDNLTYYNVIPRIYKSIELITNNYDDNKYVKFYNKYFNGYYTLTMAFGINGYLELLFFKSKEEGNFTTDEINELKNIYTYLGNGYSTYKKHEQRLIFSELQNKIVQIGSKAYFITDDFLHIMYYNDLAKEYLCDLLGPQTAFGLDDYSKKYWLQLLYETDSLDDIQHKKVKNYDITIHRHDQSYTNNIIDRYYWITIDKHTCVDKSNSIFTKSEKQVCELILIGKKYNEIAEDLFISYHTAKKHVANIYKKTNVNSRFEFITWYNNHNK